MTWQLVALTGIVLAWLLGVHIIAAYERNWKLQNTTWAELERDKMATAVGQTGQMTEMLRQLGIRPPGQEDP